MNSDTIGMLISGPLLLVIGLLTRSSARTMLPRIEKWRERSVFARFYFKPFPGDKKYNTSLNLDWTLGFGTLWIVIGALVFATGIVRLALHGRVAGW